VKYSAGRANDLQFLVVRFFGLPGFAQAARGIRDQARMSIRMAIGLRKVYLIAKLKQYPAAL
jgi:hypothetical protein